MQKITGIKSVDFKVTAQGYGVVNWNGKVAVRGGNGKDIENHTMPKLRGYSNLTGDISEKGHKFKKSANDLDFAKNPLYISQNCLRHHLYREHAYDSHFANKDNALDLLASIIGLVRGYSIPSVQYKRASSLLITDFVDTLGNGNFEQLTKAGERDSNSLFSKTTFGETAYIGYGSINIEQLQFIPLDAKFDRQALLIKDGQGDEVAKRVQNFIQSLDPALSPAVTFHDNYVRQGTIFQQGEMGLLLDDTAIDIAVRDTLKRIENLSIKQGKGYMFVDGLTVDYNDSPQSMRIKTNPSSICPERNQPYACYYVAR